MSTPAVYVAFEPTGRGLLCAVIYTVADGDVYGWWIGRQDQAYPSAFFMLPAFLTSASPAFLATRGTDAFGGWAFDYAAPRPALDQPIPIDEALRDRLNELQSTFASEWLFRAEDKTIVRDLGDYARLGVTVQEVNVKSNRLKQMTKAEPVWTYSGHGLSMEIVEYLATRWPLDYRLKD